MSGDAKREEIGVTKYLPSIWLDEVVPAPQRDVNDFIHRLDNGTWIMMPKDEADQDEEFWRTPLELGQVVAFAVHEWYGWMEIHVNEDGSIDDGEVPDKANCLCLDGEIETMADNVKDLVENGDGEPLKPGSYHITAYYWADTETHFRFIVDADGNGRFEPCAGAN
ncbi:hypothetical protein GGE07_002505 [Sinorhizobium terangae]|uniref:Uncharacterized protein n=1 Tax=Sinorhizobium terangae TaxID=110322 RepID=A0A6N7LKN1_SINTE|nr:hypothetical protein [Sinorhizobium terangae]MBB4185855.1 hypothetical protein [Sinorhizobium terangae]MQX17768.1 hypothetical protein [Sinorhizobium terangae]